MERDTLPGAVDVEAGEAMKTLEKGLKSVGEVADKVTVEVGEETVGMAQAISGKVAEGAKQGTEEVGKHMGDAVVEMGKVAEEAGEAAKEIASKAMDEGKEIASGVGGMVQEESPEVIAEAGEVVKEGGREVGQQAAPVAAEGSHIGMLILTVLVNAINLIADLARSFLNVSMIANSMHWIRPELPLQVNVSLKGFHPALGPLNTLFDGIVLSVQGIKWNSITRCPGVQKSVQLVMLMVAMLAIYFLLEKNVLLRLAITSKKIIKGSKSKAKRYAFTGFLKLVVSAAFYLLQYAALMIPALLILISKDGFSIKSECGNSDQQLLGVIVMFMWPIWGIALEVYIFVFASDQEAIDGMWSTIKHFTKKGKKGQQKMFWLLIGMIGAFLKSLRFMPRALLRILAVSFGLWTSRISLAYEIKERAEKYDDDDEDDDNQVERVCELVGKSTGVFWITIPLCTALTKLSEYSNSPAFWDFADDLDMITKKGKRGVKYFFQVIKLASIVCTVLFPSMLTVVLLNVAVLPGFFVDLVSDIVSVVTPPSAVVPMAGQVKEAWEEKHE